MVTALVWITSANDEWSSVPAMHGCNELKVLGEGKPTFSKKFSKLPKNTKKMLTFLKIFSKLRKNSFKS